MTWFCVISSGKLTATRGACPRRVSTCRILVIDEEDDLAALFKGIAYIKGTSLDASA